MPSGAVEQARSAVLNRGLSRPLGLRVADLEAAVRAEVEERYQAAAGLFEQYRHLMEDHYAYSCLSNNPCYVGCYGAWAEERDSVKASLRALLPGEPEEGPSTEGEEGRA